MSATEFWVRQNKLNVNVNVYGFVWCGICPFQQHFHVKREQSIFKQMLGFNMEMLDLELSPDTALHVLPLFFSLIFRSFHNSSSSSFHNFVLFIMHKSINAKRWQKKIRFNR